jgi:hypothetical protein
MEPFVAVGIVEVPVGKVCYPATSVSAASPVQHMPRPMVACVLMRCVMGSFPKPVSAFVSCGRDTLIPASINTLPSDAVSTAMFPPEL